MKRSNLFLAAALMSGSCVRAQQNTDVSILTGLSQRPSAVIAGTQIRATSIPGFTVVNYGYQILRRPAGEIWIETPIVIGYVSSDTATDNGTVSSASNSLFAFTPGLRFRIPTESRFSIYGAAGFGYGSFTHHQYSYGPGVSVSEFRTIRHGVGDVAVGVDFRLTRLVSLRAEVRDIISGTNLAGVSGHNHPVYAFGVGFHF